MRRLWAIARTTFIECLRTRIVAALLVVLGAGLLAMGLTVSGDGTLTGRTQTFLSYSTVLSQLLLGAVTIILATSLVAGDIRRKTIFTVVSKPVRRWQVLLGRWLGLAALNVLLVAGVAAEIYGLAQYLRSKPTAVEADKAAGRAKADRPDLDRYRIDNELFTARAAHNPQPIDIADRLQRRIQWLEEKGLEPLFRQRLRDKIQADAAPGTSPPPIDDREIDQRLADPELRGKLKAEIYAEIKDLIAKEAQLIRTGGSIRLDFIGLTPPRGPRDTLQIRYRIRPLTRPDSMTLKSMWQIRNNTNGYFQIITRTDSTETGSSFRILPQAVTDAGTLSILYINLPDRRFGGTVKVDPADISVFYRIGSFEGNLARAATIIGLRMMFLSAIGVLFGVAVSFPIACMLGLVVLGVGMMSGFIAEATRTDLPGPAASATIHVSKYLAKVVFAFIPNLTLASTPGDALVDGLIIPPAAVAREALTGAGLRALLALGLGWLIFRRRELARVQV